MEFHNLAFWLFLAAVCVASLAFVSILAWSGNRLQERKDYYRFEFRKRLAEAGKMDATSLASLMRYEHELRLQQGRQKLMVTAFVFVGVGVGVVVGFQFIGDSVWMLGLVPLCIGLSMLVFGFFFAAKPNPGPPPLGWSPEPDGRD